MNNDMPGNVDPVTGLPSEGNSALSTYIISFKNDAYGNFPDKVGNLLQELGVSVPQANARPLDALQVLIVDLPDIAAEKLAQRPDLLVEADQEVLISAPPPGKGPNKGPDSGDGGGGSGQLKVWNNSVNPLLEDPGWNVTPSAKRIFILDTGISTNTGDLNIDESASADFTGSSRKVTWRDQNGHGTHVAGTAAAVNDNDGIAGIAAGATVVSVKVLDRRGSGTLSGVLSGVNHVALFGKPGDVANLSLGLNGVSETFDNAIKSAAQKGILFAVAAGNDGSLASNYSPATAANGVDVHAIAAHDVNGNFAGFSNYGSPVQFSAPGVDIASLGINGSIVIYSGTSMATPAAAGQLYLTGNLEGISQIISPAGYLTEIQIPSDFFA